MAKEKTYSEVLNLRIDRAMRDEITRIGQQRGESESECARRLLHWGITAHRDMEAKALSRPYDAELPDVPVRMVVGVHWEEFDPDDPMHRYEADTGRWSGNVE
jgi:hypothetical protein